MHPEVLDLQQNLISALRWKDQAQGLIHRDSSSYISNLYTVYIQVIQLEQSEQVWDEQDQEDRFKGEI